MDRLHIPLWREAVRRFGGALSQLALIRCNRSLSGCELTGLIRSATSCSRVNHRAQLQRQREPVCLIRESRLASVARDNQIRIAERQKRSDLSDQ